MPTIRLRPTMERNPSAPMMPVTTDRPAQAPSLSVTDLSRIAASGNARNSTRNNTSAPCPAVSPSAPLQAGKGRRPRTPAGAAGAAVGGAADGGAVAGAAAPPQLGPQPAVAPRLPGGGRSDRGRRRVDLVPGRLGADAQPARSTLSRHPGQRAAGHAACTAWRQSGAARAEAADRHRRQGHPACTGQQAAPAGERDGRDRARR
ncbi:hypothetical protein G6F68_012358 [Rhizopus microsporus]|nr:hypothetical protein G6F68_012358 [Rhizopus microsporus]